MKQRHYRETAGSIREHGNHAGLQDFGVSMKSFFKPSQNQSEMSETYEPLFCKQAPNPRFANKM